MASRTARVASSLVAGILAGVPLTAPRSAANAAECLSAPGRDAPQGQHWYYRIEHSTKRHCWYTRDGSGKAAQTGASDDSAQGQAAAPTQASKAATQTSANPARSLEDARAEYPMPQARANTMTAPAPGAAASFAGSPAAAAPQADTQGSAVAARWPSPESAAAPTAPPAAADATDSAPATAIAAAAPSDAPAPAAADPAPARPAVSLQMLFAVIGGALALAGLTASVVYRLGRGRPRRLDTQERRAVLWEGVETGARPPWVEPVIEETAPDPAPERRAAQGANAQQRYDKIEEILAQLVKQGQQSGA